MRKKSKVPSPYLVACWILILRRRKGKDGEEGDRERETGAKERVRHAPDALKVNLENQIKAVFWSRTCQRQS